MAKPKKEAEEMYNWFLGIFGCKELHHLPDKVLEKILAGDTAIYEEYIKKYPDLKTDSLREFFETYLSDRKFLSQDFTPDSISQLLKEIFLIGCEDPPKEVLDDAAGIGCLIIPYWRYNPDIYVWARELSAATIPFLLFNLAVRNMHGVVIRGNTLTLETFNVYVLNKGEKFSTVTEIDLIEEVKRSDPVLLLKAMMAYSPERFRNERAGNQGNTKQIGFFEQQPKDKS